MLDEKERKRAERSLKEEEQEWFVRVGLDWIAAATGVLMCVVALRQLPWSDELGFALLGAFLIGGTLTRAFVAPQSRLLAKLYRAAKAGEARSA
jgi:hypothetical protein